MRTRRRSRRRWPTDDLPRVRKPSALNPRSVHDFSILAARVAECPNPDLVIAGAFGVEEEYVDRLVRSTAGGAFSQWLEQQGEDITKHYRLPTDQPAQLAAAVEEAEIHDQPDPENAFSKFLATPD